MSADLIARAWLERQKASNKEPMLDEGDCTWCGRPAGDGHEPTDPCGIVAGLLDLLTTLQAATLELEQTVQELQNAARVEPGATTPSAGSTAASGEGL